MAFCSSCGGNIADGAAFCPQCGKGQGAAAGGAGAAQSGLAENVAGGLSYVFGWLTGIIFLLIDKRPSVRFHAAQSIVVFGALHIIQIVFGYVFGFGFLFGGGATMGTWAIAGLVSTVIGLACLILWILLMVKAFQGEKFRVPVAADFAEKLAGK